MTSKKSNKKQNNSQGKVGGDNAIMDKEVSDKLNVLKVINYIKQTKSKELFDKSCNIFSEKNMRSLISPIVLQEKPEKGGEKLERIIEKQLEN